jgi:hypothetical protein
MSRASLSREAMRAMVDAVPDAEVRGILRDGRATQNLRPLAEASARPRVAQENRSGWREAQPLSPPPGVGLADKLVDAQDRRDRAALFEAEARRRAAIKAATDPAPNNKDASGANYDCPNQSNG